MHQAARVEVIQSVGRIPELVEQVEVNKKRHMRPLKTMRTNSKGLACELSRMYFVMQPFLIHGETKQNSAKSLEMPKTGRMFLCLSRFQRTASL